MRDASGRRSASLREDGRDVAPSVDPAQPDLAADNESDEQDERGIFGGQATLGLHTPAELLVQRVPRRNAIRAPSLAGMPNGLC
jgi:hypothetical protein